MLLSFHSALPDHWGEQNLCLPSGDGLTLCCTIILTCYVTCVYGLGIIKYGNQACWPSQAGKSPCLVLTEAPCSICSAIPLPFPGQCLENLLMFFCKICVQSKKKKVAECWVGMDETWGIKQRNPALQKPGRSKESMNKTKGFCFFLHLYFQCGWN